MVDRPALLSLDDALGKLLTQARLCAWPDQEEVATLDALGRVLSQSVCSTLDVPPADNSSMDGYAVRVGDLADAGRWLTVSQRIPAGFVGQPLATGTVARIFTGAQIPPGADAVVMQENCESMTGLQGQTQVRFATAPRPGQWIRQQGEDVRQGAEVLTAGRRLDPAALGMAASVGAATLWVRRRPRVALFSTGDELVMPGHPLKPGAIYNSNRFMLQGLLKAAGCEVIDLGIVPDQLEATQQALRSAAAATDLIITSGGVSMGEEDHLRPALQTEGRLDLWQVAIKPGKPLAFGAVRSMAGETLYIGLPGNPVSSFVTFLLAVGPVLRVLQGMAGELPSAWPLRADFDWLAPDRRREFLRVRLNSSGGLDLFANQGSGVLTSAVWADGLVDNPPMQVIRRGDVVQMLSLAALVGS